MFGEHPSSIKPLQTKDLSESVSSSLQLNTSTITDTHSISHSIHTYIHSVHILGNMDPFETLLSNVLQSRHVAAATTTATGVTNDTETIKAVTTTPAAVETKQNNHVTVEMLIDLCGQLSNGTRKLEAIDAGLLGAVLAIYQQNIESKHQEEVRRVCVEIVRSCVFLKQGRDVVLPDASQLAIVLKDPASSVRISACSVFTSLSQFPDAAQIAMQNKDVITALVHTFVHDEQKTVQCAALSALANFSEFHFEVEKETLAHVKTALSETCASHEHGEQTITSNLLRFLVNVLPRDSNQQLAIELELVNELARCVLSSKMRIRAVAVACLGYIVVSLAGKKSISSHGMLVNDISNIFSDNDASDALLTNAKGLVQSTIELPQGLEAFAQHLLRLPTQTAADLLGLHRTVGVLSKMVHKALDTCNESKETTLAQENAAVAVQTLHNLLHGDTISKHFDVEDMCAYIASNSSTIVKALLQFWVALGSNSAEDQTQQESKEHQRKICQECLIKMSKSPVFRSLEAQVRNAMSATPDCTVLVRELGLILM
jgi:hypothetical protein